MGDKFWTIQKRSVLDTIEREGVYYPDNEKSQFVAENPELLRLYQQFTDSFNRWNDTECKGLVFLFVGCNDMDFYSELHFETYDEFKAYMKKYGPGKIDALWKKLIADDSVVLELEFDEYFCQTLTIDINDFQFLMPPVLIIPPYTKDSLEQLKLSIKCGDFDESDFPSGILQDHRPYIKKENIVGVYETFQI